MLADAEIVELAPEVPHDKMTDAELVAVIINDPDTMTRRRALHVMRIREFTAGAKSATNVIDAVMGLYK